MDFKIDRYTLNARLAPMLITLMPIGLAIISLFPNSSSGLGLVIGAVSYCGMLVLLSNLGRDLGKEKEKALFEKWGGKPTTIILNEKTSSFSKTELKAIQAKLAELTKTPLPEGASAEEENQVYDTWTSYLIANTRGDAHGQFKMVLAENINFGFRRNLLGLRWYGFWLAVAALIIIIGDHSILTWGGAKAWQFDMLDLRPSAKSAILITVCTAWIFFFIVKDDWVKLAGNAYAKQLVKSTYVLKEQSE